MKKMKNYLKIKELCELIDITLSKARSLVFHKKIPYYKVGNEIRFKASEVEEWIAERKIQEGEL